MSVSTKLLWTPSPAFRESSRLTEYINWLQEKKGLAFHDYQQLWDWSVNDIETFWRTIWQFFDIRSDGSLEPVLSGREMPHSTWFGSARLSYAEHVFKNATGERPAIIAGKEDGSLEEISWPALKDQVAAVAKALRAAGVKPGDRVAAFVPCIPEATAAFLATNAVGAVWASCSPDFGLSAVSDRFAQITPKVLFTVDKYNYGGKTFDRHDVVSQLIGALPQLQRVILISEERRLDDSRILLWKEVVADGATSLSFQRVPFSHPIWVLYSSGTTGLPKAITHSVGGILLEHLKYCSLHNDFRPGDRCFWYTTTGWMMWNYIQASLLCGATMVLYDGSPAYPSLDALWLFAEKARVNHFGTSAGFILANRDAGLQPGREHDLGALRSIGSTGSTLPQEGFEWVYSAVKKDVWLASVSGGTDVCSVFVGGNPLLPVYSGELQCRALGCRLEVFNEAGASVVEEEGEMVITAPMPSMPVFFWNDPDFERYRESYFEMYPGVWRHGDWVRLTERGGLVIYGRSDATLNRAGIRIGTSEIYRAVNTVEEIADSLIICIEKSNGTFWMPLFVKVKPGHELTADLKKKINTALRSAYSPRHVPDEIIEVPDIPYTISGKKTEMPVKKVFMGLDPARVVNKGSLRNPESMDAFIAINDSLSP